MINQEKKRIVLTGGLSGGHVYPLVAVARAIRTETTDPVKFLYIGSKGTFEDKAMHDDGIKTRYIFSGKVRRYFSLMNLLDQLIETCKLNGVNPREYFKRLVEDLLAGRGPSTPLQFKQALCTQ